jgi:hypothetical protein
LICKATRAKRTHDLRRCLRSPPNDASWNICKPKMSSNMFDEWWILPFGSLRKCNISTKTMTLTPSVLICTKTKIDTNHLRKNIVFARLRGGEMGKGFERGAYGPAECRSV